MNRNALMIVVVLLLIVAVGCTSPQTGKSELPTPIPPQIINDSEKPSAPAFRVNDSGSTAEGTQQFVSANNKFTIDFYAKLQSNPDYEKKNLFFSPYSISTAFAMVYEGAKTKTAEEMRNVFYFPEEDVIRRSSAAALYNKLNVPNAPYELRTANALWVQQDYQLLKEYLNAVERYYGGKATNVDFEGATEETRKMINQWVEEKTNDKIKDLFPSGSLSSDTRLAITNAVYFKGKWLEQFDPDKTKEEDFRVLDKTVRVPMMRNTASFGYTENEMLQILEMPYQGESLSMLILLPKNDDLKELEQSLSTEKLEEWKKKIYTQEVEVYIPKFELKEKYDLKKMLKDMGVPSAFTSEADLSGMDGTRSLYIATAVHQSFVQVNEEGTEAAAATGIGIEIDSIPPPPPVFRADHPFIFLIQEKETGAILFIGRVIDPTK